jgi:hypothetical protein
MGTVCLVSGLVPLVAGWGVGVGGGVVGGGQLYASRELKTSRC